MGFFKWFRRKRRPNGVADPIQQRKTFRNPTRSDVLSLAKEKRLFVATPETARSELSEAEARKRLNDIVTGKLPVYEMVESLEGGYKYRRRYSKPYLLKVFKKWVDYATKNYRLLSKKFDGLDSLEVTLPRQFAFAQMSEIFLELRVEEFKKMLELAEKSKDTKQIESFRWALNRAIREKATWKNRQYNLKQIDILVKRYRETKRKISDFEKVEDFFSIDSHQLKSVASVNLQQLGKATKGIQDAVLGNLRERSRLLNIELELYRNYKYRFSHRPISEVENARDTLDDEVIRVAKWIVSRRRKR